MLEKAKAAVIEERSTRKPLTPTEVRALLAEVETVIVAHGRAAESRPAKKVKPADLKGPTGSFRAPMVRRGKTLLVGFNAESLAALVG